MTAPQPDPTRPRRVCLSDAEINGLVRWAGDALDALAGGDGILAKDCLLALRSWLDIRAGGRT